MTVRTYTHWFLAHIHINIKTISSGANPPLQNLLIKFDVAIATLESLLKMAVPNPNNRLNKTDMEKAG